MKLPITISIWLLVAVYVCWKLGAFTGWIAQAKAILAGSWEFARYFCEGVVDSVLCDLRGELPATLPSAFGYLAGFVLTLVGTVTAFLASMRWACQ